MPTRASFGVILCRRGAAGRPEVLLVLRRYTYAFAEFIHGRYAQDRRCPALRGAAQLMDLMTREELLAILSLDFGQMWYRVWLSHDNRDLFARKSARFEANFMRDGGAALRAAVMLARGGGALLWGVPKGRRLNAREAATAAATRELREETGVDKFEYRLLPGARRRVCYVAGGVRYSCVYYVALANPRCAAGGIDFSRPLLRGKHPGDMAEIGEVRWFDIEHIRMLGEGAEVERLAALVAPAFRLMKLYVRGRWAARPDGGDVPIPS